MIDNDSPDIISETWPCTRPDGRRFDVLLTMTGWAQHEDRLRATCFRVRLAGDPDVYAAQDSVDAEDFTIDADLEGHVLRVGVGVSRLVDKVAWDLPEVDTTIVSIDTPVMATRLLVRAGMPVKGRDEVRHDVVEVRCGLVRKRVLGDGWWLLKRESTGAVLGFGPELRAHLKAHKELVRGAIGTYGNFLVYED